jgi:hypothetical protein
MSRTRSSRVSESNGAFMKSGLAMGFALALVSGAATSGAEVPAPLSRPDWTAIFGPDGTVINLQGGLDAVFLEDKISDGVGVDMSVIAPPATTTVNNGVIAAANDLANGYVYAKADGSGNLQLYAGVERLDSSVDTYVEFEFNQDVVQVRSGVPWPVYGSRTAGDVLVRVDFVAGALSSATFMQWDGSGYQPIATAGAGGCSGVDYLVCVGAPPQETVQAEVWDAAYNPVQVPQPNSFVEIGVNVAALPASNGEFTSIQVRTAEDTILDSFRRIGYWAHHGLGGGQ